MHSERPKLYTILAFLSAMGSDGALSKTVVLCVLHVFALYVSDIIPVLSKRTIECHLPDLPHVEGGAGGG